MIYQRCLGLLSDIEKTIAAVLMITMMVMTALRDYSSNPIKQCCSRKSFCVDVNLLIEGKQGIEGVCNKVLRRIFWRKSRERTSQEAASNCLIKVQLIPRLFIL
jgi:hypothetical protein